jgi:hypothetical protein
MSILKFPNDDTIPAEVVCVLCGKCITTDWATFGPINAEGSVTILCAGHLWDGLSFIDKMADYMAQERAWYFRNNGNNAMRFGGGWQDVY